MIEQKNNIISKGCTLGITHINSPISFSFIPSIDPAISQSMTGDPVPSQIIKNAPHISLLFGSDVYDEFFFQEIDRAIKVFGGFLPIRCEEITELLLPLDSNLALYAGVGSELVRQLPEPTGDDSDELRILKEKVNQLETDAFVQLLQSNELYLETYSSVFFKNYVMLYSVINRQLTIDNNITYYQLTIEPVDMTAYFPDGVMRFLKDDISVIDQEVLKRYLDNYGSTMINPNYLRIVKGLTSIVTPTTVASSTKQTTEDDTDTSKSIVNDYTAVTNKAVTVASPLSKVYSIPTEYVATAGDFTRIRSFQTNGNKISDLPMGRGCSLTKEDSKGTLTLEPYSVPAVPITSIFENVDDVSENGEYLNVDDGDTFDYVNDGVKRSIRVLGVDSFETPKFTTTETMTTMSFMKDPLRDFDLHIKSIYNGIKSESNIKETAFNISDDNIIPFDMYFKLDNNIIVPVDMSEDKTRSDKTSLDSTVNVHIFMYYLLSIYAGHKLFDHLNDADFKPRQIKIHWSGNDKTKSYDRHVGYVENFSETVMYGDITEPGFLPAGYSVKKCGNQQSIDVALEYIKNLFKVSYDYVTTEIANRVSENPDVPLNMLILKTLSPIHVTTYLFGLAYSVYSNGEVSESMNNKLAANLEKYLTATHTYVKRHFKNDDVTPTSNYSHTSSDKRYTTYKSKSTDTGNNIKLYDNSTDVSVFNWTLENTPLNFGSLLLTVNSPNFKPKFKNSFLEYNDSYCLTSSLVYDDTNNTLQRSLGLTEVFTSFSSSTVEDSVLSFPGDVSLIDSPEQFLEIAERIVNNSTLYPELSKPYTKLINSIYEPMYAGETALKYTYPSNMGEDSAGEDEYYPLLGLNNNTYGARNPMSNNDILIHYSALNTLTNSIPEIARDVVFELLYTYVPNTIMPIIENYKLNVFNAERVGYPDGTLNKIIPNTQIMEAILNYEMGTYSDLGYDPVAVGNSQESLIRKIFSGINAENDSNPIQYNDVKTKYNISSRMSEKIKTLPAPATNNIGSIVTDITSDTLKDMTFQKLYDSLICNILTVLDGAKYYLEKYYDKTGKDSEIGTSALHVFDTVIDSILEHYNTAKQNNPYTTIFKTLCTSEVTADQMQQCTFSQITKLIESSESYSAFMTELEKLEELLTWLYNITSKMYIPKTILITNSTLTSITGININYSSNNVTLRPSQTGIGSQKQYVNSSIEHVTVNLQTKDAMLIRSLLLVYYTNEVNSKAILGIDGSRSETSLSTYKSLTLWSGMEEQLTDTLEQLRGQAKQNFDFTVLLENNLLNGYGIKSGFISGVDVNMLENRVGEYSVTLTILKSTPRYKEVADLKTFNLSPFRNTITEFLIANAFDPNYVIDREENDKGLEPIKYSTRWVTTSANNHLFSILVVISTIFLLINDKKTDINDGVRNSIRGLFSGFDDMFKDLFNNNNTLSDKAKNNPQLLLYAALSFTHGVVDANPVEFNSGLGAISNYLGRIFINDKLKQNKTLTYNKLVTSLRVILTDMVNTLGMTEIYVRTNILLLENLKELLISTIDEMQTYTTSYGIDWALNTRLYILELLHANKTINIMYGTKYGIHRELSDTIPATVKSINGTITEKRPISECLTSSSITPTDRIIKSNLANISNAYYELKALTDTINELNSWELEIDKSYNVQTVPDSILDFAYTHKDGQYIWKLAWKIHPQTLRKVYSIYSIVRSYGYLSLSETRKLFDTTDVNALKYESPLVTIMIEFFYSLYRKSNKDYSAHDREENRRVKNFIKGRLIYYDIILQMLMVNDAKLGMNFNLIKHYLDTGTFNGGLKDPNIKEAFSTRVNHCYATYSHFLIQTLTSNNTNKGYDYSTTMQKNDSNFSSNKLKDENTEFQAKLYYTPTFSENVTKVIKLFTAVNLDAKTNATKGASVDFLRRIHGATYSEAITHNYRQLNLTNIYELFVLTVFGSSFNISRTLSEEIYEDYISPIVMGTSVLEHHNMVSKDVYYWSSASLMFGTLGVDSPLNTSNFDIGYYADSKLPKCYVFAKNDIFTRMNDMLYTNPNTGKKEMNTIVYSIYEQLMMGSKTCTYPYFFIMDNKIINEVFLIAQNTLYANSISLGSLSESDETPTDPYDNFRMNIESTLSTISAMIDENTTKIQTLKLELKGNFGSENSKKLFDNVDTSIQNIVNAHAEMKKYIHDNITMSKNFQDVDSKISNIANKLNNLNDKVESNTNNIKTKLNEIYSITAQQGKVLQSDMESLNYKVNEICIYAQHNVDLNNIHTNVLELYNKYIQYANGNVNNADAGYFQELYGEYHSIINPMTKNVMSTAITDGVNANIGYEIYNETTNYIAKDTSSIAKMFPTFKVLFYNDDIKELMTFENTYMFSRVISFTVGSNIGSPCSELILEIDDPFDDLTNVHSVTENRQLYGINPFKLTSMDKLDTTKFALGTGTNIQIRSGYSTVLDEDSIIFSGKINSVQGNGMGQVSISALSHGSSLSQPLSNSDLAVISPARLDRNRVDFIDFVPGASEFIYSIYELNPNAFQGVNMKDGLNSFATDQKRITTTPVSPKNVVAPHLYMNRLGIAYNNMDDNIFTNLNPVRSNDCRANKLLYKSPDSTWQTLKELQLHYQNNKLLVRPFDSKETLVFMPEDGYYLKGSRQYRSMVNSKMAIKNTETAALSQNDIYGSLNKIMENIVSTLKKSISESSTTETKDNYMIAYAVGKFILSNIEIYTNKGDSDDSDDSKKSIKSPTEILLNKELPFSINIDFLNVNLDTTNIKSITGLGNNLSTQLSDNYINKPDLMNDNPNYRYVFIKILSRINAFLKSNSKLYRKVSKTHYKLNENIIALEIEQLQNSNGVSLVFLDDAEDTDGFFNDKIGTEALRLTIEGIANWAYNTQMGDKAQANEQTIQGKLANQLEVYGKFDNLINKTLNILPFSNAGRKTSNLHESNWWKTTDYILTSKLKLDNRTFLRSEHANAVMFKNNKTMEPNHQKVVASSILNNVLNEYYGGLVTMYGDNDIFVGDKLYINDNQTSTVGMVEVRELLHNFDAHTGYTTSIVPSLISYSNVDENAPGGNKAWSGNENVRQWIGGAICVATATIICMGIGASGVVVAAASKGGAKAALANIAVKSSHLNTTIATTAKTAIKLGTRPMIWGSVLGTSVAGGSIATANNDVGWIQNVSSIPLAAYQVLLRPISTFTSWVEDDIIYPFWDGAKQHPLDNVIMPIHKKGVPLIPNIDLYPSTPSDNHISTLYRNFVYNNYGHDIESGIPSLDSK